MAKTPLAAAAVYLGVALALTWPLATGLARDVPSDLGDPVLNMWILGWNAQRLLRLVRGDLTALEGYWNANIFYPEPLALAYSEHLIAQSLQILPIYAITGNLILCYNLLFLSTFVLSGLGVFLLVRELTGSTRAAFVGGLVYAIVPYRIGQFSHIQVLSSQWMPFALFGLRRYVVTGRRVALAGAAAALVVQNNSCGYYLLYFTPFVAAYAMVELVSRGRARDWRVWRDLVVAAVVVAALTFPFYLPYMQLRARGHEPRPRGEVLYFSADVYAYLTAHSELWVWGNLLRPWGKSEGELFPGVIPLALAAWALVATFGRALRERAPPSPRSRVEALVDWLSGGLISVAGKRAIFWILCAAAAIALTHVLATVLILLGAGGRYALGPVVLRITTFWRVIRTAGGAYLVAALLSPRTRAVSRAVIRSPEFFWVVAMALAALLSFGPVIMTLGRQIGGGPYSVFYDHVPGFDGLRVPARYAMLTSLFLAVVAAYGALDIERRRYGAAWITVLATAFVLEASSAPIAVNASWGEDGVQPLIGRLYTGRQVPQIYGFVRQRLPADAVLIEFPFGADAHEIRYMYYSTVHWRPLVNGYSGGFPQRYMARRGALQRALDNPEPAWRVVTASGATHAIVHESLFLGSEAEAVSAWLHGNGARQVVSVDRDRLFELPKK